MQCQCKTNEETKAWQWFSTWWFSASSANIPSTVTQQAAFFMCNFEVWPSCQWFMADQSVYLSYILHHAKRPAAQWITAFESFEDWTAWWLKLRSLQTLTDLSFTTSALVCLEHLQFCFLFVQILKLKCVRGDVEEEMKFEFFLQNQKHNI